MPRRRKSQPVQEASSEEDDFMELDEGALVEDESDEGAFDDHEAVDSGAESALEEVLAGERPVFENDVPSSSDEEDELGIRRRAVDDGSAELRRMERKGWGRNKKAYYSGDVSDEASENDRDAGMEAEEAERLQAAQMEALDKEDYAFEDLLGGGGSKSSSRKSNASSGSKSRKSSSSTPTKMNLEKVTASAEALAGDAGVQRLLAEAPELLTFVDDLKTSLAEVQQVIRPVLAQVAHGQIATSAGVSFLELKAHLLLSYCSHITFYLMLKAKGESVKDHPVIDELLRIRVVLEKMAPVDKKLANQIGKLLSNAGSAKATAGAAPPRLEELVGDSDEESSGDEDGDSESEAEEGRRNGDVYRPPQIAAVPFFDAAERKKQKEELRRMEKAASSEMFAGLREEFGSAPVEITSTGFDSKAVEVDSEEEERLAFEEEHFVRLPMTKADKKKAAARANPRLNAFDAFDDFADLPKLPEEVARNPKGGARSDNGGLHPADAMMIGRRHRVEDIGGDNEVMELSSSARRERRMAAATSHADELVPARQQAKQTMSESKRKAMEERDFAEAAAWADPSASTKKRKRGGSKKDDPQVPLEQEDSLYKAVASNARAAKKARKDAYKAPASRPYEEDLDDGEKRAASWNILANRGLTPARGKKARNPRVKQREKYARAEVRRAGQVRRNIDQSKPYAGEKSGINDRVTHTTKLQ